MYNIFKSISVYNCMRTNVKKCESIKEILLATFLEETVTEDVLSFNNYNFFSPRFNVFQRYFIN